MGRRGIRIPGYRLHKASGQAVVRFSGRHYYLGKFGTPASREEYERLIRKHLELPDRSTAGSILPDFTVNELLVRFLRHAAIYYRLPDGRPSGEIEPLHHASRFLRDEAGTTLAEDFSPLRLAAVRERMIGRGLCRNVINGHILRIRRIFRWAVAQELVPGSILSALQALDGLRRGRSAARETDPVGPAPEEDVEKTIPHLAPPVRAMVGVHRLTAMRPGEVCAMTSGAIERTSGAWIYRPAQHKKLWRGRSLEIFLGPRAQALIAPFLSLDPDAPLFSPRDSLAYWNAKRRKREKKAGVAVPRRSPGKGYTTASYRRAISYACRKAGVEPWHPNQLRHGRATELRRDFGIEAAMAALDHSRIETTEIYAERNRALARRIAEERG